MGEEADLIKLYSQRILELAANIPLTEPLDSPDGRARARSPLCGSTVTVELILEEGKVAKFSQDVKACALGQAAASVVGKNIIGRTRSQIQKAFDQLAAMLQSDGVPPDPPFDRLYLLEPAKQYKNRHASILLALEATLSAFDRAGSTDKHDCRDAGSNIRHGPGQPQQQQSELS